MRLDEHLSNRDAHQHMCSDLLMLMMCRYATAEPVEPLNKRSKQPTTHRFNMATSPLNANSQKAILKVRLHYASERCYLSSYTLTAVLSLSLDRSTRTWF